jgi:tetratricopeptide (TPR) repeat protein
MGKLLNLTVYNPAILSDEDFIAGFVAREDVLNRLLERLRETSAARLAKQFLILGQRGMGKTSLLKRLALSVRADAALNDVLLPLTFREEQYNIHNLNIFWCNCLDALGDWFEKSGQIEKAAEIDRDVAALTCGESDPEGHSALEVFTSWTRREKKRALLLLDNIDLVLDGIARYQWNLRRALQAPNGIIVVGASAGYMEATADKDAAFYDFFQVVVLEKLGENELLACLRRLAKLRGEEGQKVIKTIDSDPGRIRTLYSLTGGNPRTLTLLYLLLEMDADGDVLGDLERLLDQATALYKARVEDLAPQARVVLDAVALSWDPITVAQLSEIISIESSAISSQLDRLQKNGIIEKVGVSSTPKAAFQLGERFFNIWYLMRHGARRQRNRLRWLTGFLREFYSPQQLTDRARNMLIQTSEHGVERGHYYIALSNAMEDTGWRHLLASKARKELELAANNKGIRLEDLVDPADLPIPVTANDWRVQGRLLRNPLKRYDEAENAYRRAIELDPPNMWSWDDLGCLLMDHLNRYTEAEDAFRKAIELDPKSAWPCYDLGNLLQKQQRYEEAENAYRQAIKCDPLNSWPWEGLGCLLMYCFNRYQEAEAAFMQAIKIDPKNAWALHALGDLLMNHLDRYEEAESVYQQAIELDPDTFFHLYKLGVLQLCFLDKQNEAENTLKEALSQVPGNLIIRTQLLVLHLTQPNPASGIDGEYENIIKQLSLQIAGLIRSIRAISIDNFGEAAKSFEEALADDPANIFNAYRGFVILLLRQAALHGYGEKLLMFMDEKGITDRYWPLRAAFNAYLHGEAKLMDVNPEVRGAATRIYGWLDSARRSKTSEPAKSNPAKPSGRKKRN